MKNGEIVEIQEIGTKSKEIIIVGKKFTALEDFYTDRCPSSALGIYVVNQLSKGKKLQSVFDVNKKIMLLTLPNKPEHFAAITMLH